MKKLKTAETPFPQTIYLITSCLPTLCHPSSFVQLIPKAIGINRNLATIVFYRIFQKELRIKTLEVMGKIIEIKINKNEIF